MPIPSRARVRLWLGAMLAAGALAAGAAAAVVWFLELSTARAAAYAAGLLLAAEILAALALLVLGRDLYRALRRRLESLRSSLEDS